MSKTSFLKKALAAPAATAVAAPFTAGLVALCGGLGVGLGLAVGQEFGSSFGAGDRPAVAAVNQAVGDTPILTMDERRAPAAVLRAPVEKAAAASAPQPAALQAAAADYEAAPLCPADRMLGGRAVTLSAGSIYEQPMDLRRLNLKKGEYVLTFDDGPTWITENILETLDSYCAKATFFMIGERAEAKPEVVRRIVREGHSLGNHTFGHVNLAELPVKEAALQIKRGREAISAVAGGQDLALIMRAPAFKISEAVREEVSRLGYVELGPDMSPRDWRGDAPEETMARMREILKEKDRGVILLHDNQPNTRGFLKLLLAEFAETGRKVVSLKLAP